MSVVSRKYVNPDFCLEYLNAARSHRNGDDFVQFPERFLKFNSKEQDVCIIIPQDYSKVGATLWDAAIVLVEYLSKILPQIDLSNKNICELGAGCCIATIYLYLSHQNNNYNCLAIQELDDIIPHCKICIQKNIKHINDDMDMTNTNIKFVGSPWNNDCVHLLRNELNIHNNTGYDLIVMSDVTYKEEDFSSLVDTIVGLVNDTTRIVIAYEQRRKDIKSVFEILLQRLSQKGSVEEQCTEYIIEPPQQTEPPQVELLPPDLHVKEQDDSGNDNIHVKDGPTTVFRVHDYQLSPFC